MWVDANVVTASARASSVDLYYTKRLAVFSQQAACCSVVGEKLQFCLSAASTAVASADPCKYTVCMAPLELQVKLLQLVPEHLLKS